jgi:hypothetical protein
MNPRVVAATVAWPGGIDLDPDSVYLDSVPLGQTAAV